MLAPSFVAAGAHATGIGAVVPALPTGWQPQDVGIMLVENQDATGIGAVTNWTVVTSQFASTGTATRLTALWRRFDAAETAPTVPDPGDHCLAVILGFRDCVSSGNPVNVFGGATELVADTTVSIAGAITTVPNTMVVSAVSTGTDVASTAHASAWTNASLAGLTERVDIWVIDGLGGGIGAATGTFASAGGYAATTATVVTANFKAMITLALRGAELPRRPRRAAHPNVRR